MSSIYNYACLIKRHAHTSKKEVTQYFPSKFKNKDYMLGFMDGLLFDNYVLYTLNEFEHLLDILSPRIDESWIVFVEIEQGEDI